MAVIVGGMDMMTQALELGNRPHVVVATPGRIVDLMRSTSGEWDLTRVKFLVRLIIKTVFQADPYLFPHRFWMKQTDFSRPPSHQSWSIYSVFCPKTGRHVYLLQP